MPRSLARAILLVDGYNIIGVWSKLKIQRDQQGLEAARRKLIEALVNYSAFEGLETRVVFDAHSRDERCYIETVTKNLSVCYTDFGQTADTYIEKACANFRRDVANLHRRFIVATSDRAQQQTVLGYGAEWMSAQQLGQAVESTARKCRRKHKTKQRPSSRFLVSGLDVESQKRLAQLRMGL
ncbi:NYN domain-containing protein [Phormidium sp. CCY1219]|uniref:NYN domain-containing protein n=1 Tax=Phormidium sp. CCY1219 TaxID=2886104 RepID=UPI002D1F6B7E|nr:NYN domain-containing protein [Phormidium sp. CCY1219]MEB3829875.1 NYN domain-containing protein [Phormidium sp. CCY1219]